jgi:hypothetical protein
MYWDAHGIKKMTRNVSFACIGHQTDQHVLANESTLAKRTMPTYAQLRLVYISSVLATAPHIFASFYGEHPILGKRHHIFAYSDWTTLSKSLSMLVIIHSSTMANRNKLMKQSNYVLYFETKLPQVGEIYVQL